MTSYKGQLLLAKRYHLFLTFLLVWIWICDGFTFLQATTRYKAPCYENVFSQPLSGKNAAIFLRMRSPANLHSNFNATGSAAFDSASEMYLPDPFRTTGFETRSTEFTVPQEKSPFPIMPSQTFLNLANSQFEILINSIKYTPPETTTGERHSKIKSLALYLPQENPNTGQLEFVPSLVFPTHPKSERIFIASDAQSGLPPTVPPTLTQLPGFAHAASLLPTYPFTSTTSSSSSSSGTVGTPEEVFCELQSSRQTTSTSASTLSLPMFSGSHTIGILLIWGFSQPRVQHGPKAIAKSMWTNEDKKQIQRVGETLAIALCMDSERFQNKIRSDEIRVAMANNLHQVKNPVQALRTFSKLLQRNLAMDGQSGNVTLSRLVDDMVVQSERVSDLLLPIDSIISSMEANSSIYSARKGLLMPTEQNDLIVKSLVEKPTMHSTMGSAVLHEGENKTRKGTSKTENSLHRGSITFVPDVLELIFSSTKAMAIERGIHLEIEGIEEELPGVFIDEKLLQEAVINVLDNAIKYVKFGFNGKQGVENNYPFVRISLTPNSEDMIPGVTITIEDNGPGIPDVDRNFVFDRGYRGNLTNMVPGSGIGLNISRMIIEGMGGSLELIDNLNGASLRFILFRRPSTE